MVKRHYGLAPHCLFITRVELRNIKNHTESTFTFQPGVISICGPNGSGKTTILEAIAWALFDHLEYKREDFVRRGTKKGQVTVGFVSDLDQREYLVTRDTGGGYYVYDPVTKSRLVEQKSQVQPWLRQRLGVEPGTDLAVLFRTTIGVPQGTFTYDFTLPPGNRKAIFDQILRVEEYRQAADTLRVPQRIAEARVIETDRQLSRLEGELASWEMTSRELELGQERLKNVESQHVTTLAKRDDLQAQVQQFDERRQSIERQRSAVGELQLRLSSLVDGLQVAREVCQQAAVAERIVREARAGSQRYLEAAAALDHLERQREDRDRGRTRLATLEHRLVEAESVERQIEERLKEVARLRLEAAPLAEEVERQKECEQNLLRLREWRGEAQSLHSSRDRLREELGNLRSRYQLLSSQIEEARRLSGEAGSIDSLELERARLEGERQRLRMAQETRQLKQEELERLGGDLARRVGEEQCLREEVAGLEKAASMAAQIPLLEERRNELVARLARQRAELARDLEMIQALESGGICPLLSERCLNLRDGETLDDRFSTGIEVRQGELDSLEQEAARLEVELRGARQAALDHSRLSRELLALDDLVVRRAELERQIDRMRVEISLVPPDAKEQEQRSVKRLREIDTEIRSARESQRLVHQAEVLTEERLALQREGEIRRAEFERLESRLAVIGDVDRSIDEAERELAGLGDPRTHLLALRQIINSEPQLQAELRLARDSADIVRIEVEPLRQRQRLFETLDQQLADTAQRRALHQSDYLLFIANEKLAVTLEAREAEVQRLAVDHDLTQRSWEECRVGLATLEAGYDPQLHRAIQDSYDQSRETLARLASEREHLVTQVAVLSDRLDSLTAVRVQQSQLGVERDRLIQLGTRTELIRETLLKSAPFITESYLFSISHEANQLYREISGRYDVTLRWTREYEILLEESGYERPFTSLSGGEQMAAALAVRLALLRELSEIDLAIFDEPTTNMDEERRRNLALQLGRIRDFNQLFVISHDDSFEGLTDQQISLGNPS